MVNRFKYKYFFGIKKKHILILFPFLIIGGILTAEALIILFMNHGLFLYTLDDPYIHLALADHIMQGHYGINHVEASSPSSSMIWPILLAPWVPLVGSFAPILLNVITTIALIPVLGSYLDRIGLAVQGTSHSGIMVCGIIVMTNVIGLTFTGLEHVLQVFCAVLVVKGVVQELEAGYCASWFLAALVMGPLIRYESLAITVPVSLYCVVRGHGRLTLSACGVTLSMLFAFSIFLHSLGLNWLPSSVLAKAVPVTQSSTIIGILGHLKEKLATPPALFLMTMVVGLGLAALQRGRNKAERSLAISGASSGLLHLFFGEFGWYHRYEIYMVIYCLLLTLYIWRKSIAYLLSSRPLVREMMVACCISVSVMSGYIGVLFTTPLASHNIYGQQYQMRRFAHHFLKAPFAVNDLGLAAYRSPYYVLDLWGLGSFEAISHRRNRDEPNWMAKLARRHGVQVAIIYDVWFSGKVPQQWQRLARLSVEGPNIVLGNKIVDFYVTNPSYQAHVVNALRDFRSTLPKGSRLELVAH